MLQAMNKLRYFICFVLCMASVTVAWADGVADLLPQKINRITQQAELKEGDCYAVLKNMGTESYLMQATLLKLKDKCCLTAAKCSEKTDELSRSLTVKSAKELWHLGFNESGKALLRCAETGQYLGREAKNEESLTFCDAPSACCEWELTARTDGSFDLAIPGTARVIEYGFRSSRDLFSFYSRSVQKGLWLYRLPTHYADVEGQATVPANGARVVLCNMERVRSAEGGALTADDYLLTDGRLANLPGAQILTCEHLGNGDFALRLDAGTYLDYGLTASSHRSAWRVVNGQVRTAEAQPRFLCYDASMQLWRVVAEPEASTTALFVALAPNAEFSITDEGIGHLSGGWGANELANLCFEGVNALDLTAALLPRKVLPFRQIPADRNVAIYVAEADGGRVMHLWPFVIGCGATNRLLARYELKDKAALTLHRPFRVEAGMLTYRRSRPAVPSWQTVCLPFDVNHLQLQVAELSGWQGETLTFRNVNQLQAGVAYIVYVSADLYWQNAACTVEPTIRAATLQGTYQPFVVRESDASASTYLLHPEQKAFVPAPAGSSLAPFRARLSATQMSGKDKMRPLLRFKIPK